MFFKKNMPTNVRILLGISLLLRLSLIYAIGLGIWTSQWLAVFVSSAALFLTFLPSLIAHNYTINLPVEFELSGVIFIYLSLILGNLRGYYDKFWWWDNILHTSAGIAFGFIGFLIVYILYKAGKINTKPIFLAMFAFLFALSLGALWEIFEFNMDNAFHTNMQRRETNIIDTMNDLTEDAFGALLISLSGFFYVRGVKGSGLFDYLVRRFLRRNPHLFEDER